MGVRTLYTLQSLKRPQTTIVWLKKVKGGILAIFNSICTKKCSPPPILPTIQVSLELIVHVQK